MFAQTVLVSLLAAVFGVTAMPAALDARQTLGSGIVADIYGQGQGNCGGTPLGQGFFYGNSSTCVQIEGSGLSAIKVTQNLLPAGCTCKSLDG